MPLRAPADRMPLLHGKNVRDEWEWMREKVRSRVGVALGNSWNVVTDPELLYVYADDDSQKARLGNIIMWYMEAFCTNLESFVKTYGSIGTRELNMLCNTKTVELAPQEDDTKFAHGGLHIRNGELRLLFAEGSFGVNVSEVSRDIAGAVKVAAAACRVDNSAMININANARQSIRESYDPNIESVQSAMAVMVGTKRIELNPNFEANAALLAGAGPKVRDDWDKVLGLASLDYFSSLTDQLSRAGFEHDRLLQTGFQEEVFENIILLRVVEKLQKTGQYHEVLVEDGVLVIQTTPESFWVNTSDVGSEILEIL
ncbi:hypothetical protein AYL99_01555 [Fonsecaea erecta]|uniref:Uncharacterized protein n=1 Tax=Fonsecaea erecta TaxID=1367422 RepID=A0A179A2G2_9EURO|nr:hypothetical protein AYL99_01555 [Fonsecaea erecta]OAP65583.1 hypothetical protein AYL99_01555 [Fonsecaea erecta]